jgi:hypothetical protein
MSRDALASCHNDLKKHDTSRTYNNMMAHYTIAMTIEAVGSSNRLETMTWMWLTRVTCPQAHGQLWHSINSCPATRRAAAAYDTT